MKNITILLIYCIGVFSAFGQNESTEAKLQALLQEAVNKEKVVGISAGMMVNDTVILTFSEGYSDLENKIGFSDQTISRIASITKPMTAISIFQLAEQGKLGLDDRVGTYVPRFTESPLQNITIRHLLQHSSGISQYKNKKEAANEKEYSTLGDALKIFIDRELLFNPGSDFYYTSFGYVVLGMVIEKASGLSYEEYLKRNIFDVADMSNTSVERQGRNYTGKSKVYHQSKPGKIRQIKNSNLSDRLPGGGVQSTATDLLKFAKAVLNHKLISSESFQSMITSSGLKKEGNAYGMGWFLYGDNPNYGNIIGHNGAQYGCSSFLFIFPEYNAATIALSNTSGFEEIGNISISMIKMAKEAKTE